MKLISPKNSFEDYLRTYGFVTNKGIDFVNHEGKREIAIQLVSISNGFAYACCDFVGESDTRSYCVENDQVNMSALDKEWRSYYRNHLEELNDI